MEKAEIEQVKARHQPRLLSENGPAYLSGEFRTFLADWEMQRIRSAPYHPMTQGEIECWHRSMKNVVKLRNYHFSGELEHAIEAFVEYYNHERYHESLENLTPADDSAGAEEEVLGRGEQIKLETLKKRRHENWGWVHV